MSNRIKRIIPVLVYGFFYMLSFSLLEKRTVKYTLIHSGLDDHIPFCEFFIVPYLLWFVYIAATVIFFAFFNESSKEYYQLLVNLGLGMTLFIIISYVYPNGLALRPSSFPRDNIFTTLVQYLYRIDTPTNVLPSIHVYNSVAAFCAINVCQSLKKHKVIRYSSLILTVLIVLSTMFLKQHSISDVVLGLTIAVASYLLIYKVFSHVFEHQADPQTADL